MLVALVVSAFALALFNFHAPNSIAAGSPKHVFVGVETGWDSNVTDCEALIDRVKGYTNLLVLASPLVLSDEALLNETCDYAYNAGMSILVYFGDLSYSSYFPPTSHTFTPSAWFTSAKERYGDRLLGIYFGDERGGKTLDQNAIDIFNPPDSYAEFADSFQQTSASVRDAATLVHNLGASVFTSDYALYWFDYKSGYDVVLAQFGWNNSRPLQIALTRGAATTQGKAWGAIVTWTYDQPPYLETGAQLYNDMVLAYESGAAYVAIYDSSKGYQNTTLTQEHYDALKKFWTYTQSNPRTNGSPEVASALVLPQDYGFGFRNAGDSVWSVKPDDNWTRKLFSDVMNQINQANSTFDVVYADPEFQSTIQSKYGNLTYWPKDFETNTTDYPVVNLNSGFGYSTIQEAISSFATYDGDTISVKPGTYREHIVVGKPVTLISQTNGAAIVDGMGNGTAIKIAANTVTLEGFAVKNGGNVTAATGGGIILENAHSCTLIGNTVSNSYEGILLNDSSNNVLRNNTMSSNRINFGVSSSNLMNNPTQTIVSNGQNITIIQPVSTVHTSDITDFLNDVDGSNIINGKPIYYWVNKSDMTIPSNAEFVALINCKNIKVQNLDLSNNYEGLLLVNVTNSAITNNTLHGNHEGIILDTSSDNTLKGNRMTGNTLNFRVVNAMPNDVDTSNLVDGRPIYFWVSRSNRTVPADAGYVALLNCTNITVQNLRLENNGQGILLSGTTNTTIANNVISSELKGIELTEATNITISANKITNNTVAGISATQANENIFAGNELSANGKAIVLTASSSNRLNGNIISRNDVGIWMENSTVSNTTGNVIFSNILSENGAGIDIEQGAENNTIYQNNFLSNTQQVSGYGMIRPSSNPWGNAPYPTMILWRPGAPQNSWDNGAVGNYWSDYTGVDANHDGIGDEPYSINYADSDRYPLMQPFSIP